MNSLFKVVQEEKEPHSPNNYLFMNNEKNSSKNQSKNINIIKPKFVTKTMHNENIKLKNVEESSSLNLNLSLNLNSSAFQPQIILKDKELLKDYASLRLDFYDEDQETMRKIINDFLI